MDDAVELRRLRNEHGVTVRVDDDTAARLLAEGWKGETAEEETPPAPPESPVEEETPAEPPAKRATRTAKRK